MSYHGEDLELIDPGLRRGRDGGFDEWAIIGVDVSKSEEHNPQFAPRLDGLTTYFAYCRLSLPLTITNGPGNGEEERVDPAASTHPAKEFKGKKRKKKRED
ncbi:hypothetical protein CEXT_38851 [Caerostris extrusa]|uniref:Uncharacterized protein n=1 Tax=Caerostris extrusa TaxID=172846 RepID=A0AAV4P1X9_CAEEX|nr:hypothetical protein CEXT_38851 [Caerostris extrusa]